MSAARAPITAGKLADVASAALAAELAPYAGRLIRFGGDVLGGYFSGVGRTTREGVLGALTDEVGGGLKGAKSPKYKGNVGTFERDGKTFAHMRKPSGSYPEWAQAAYEHPATTAEIASRVVPAAGLLAGAGALNWFAESGGSPRSDYSLPVDPNPNVTAANVSYQNQSALEEQKFRHHMALQQARAQSRIPGPQDTSVGSYGGGPYDSSEALNIVKGIYG